jgi:hypothetical protein
LQPGDSPAAFGAMEATPMPQGMPATPYKSVVARVALRTVKIGAVLKLELAATAQVNLRGQAHSEQ